MKKVENKEQYIYHVCFGRTGGATGRRYTLYRENKISQGKWEYIKILGLDLKECIEKANVIADGCEVKVDADKSKNFDTETYVPINFGKYKGRYVSWIIENDIDYIFWLADNNSFLPYRILRAMEEVCKKHQKGHFIEPRSLGEVNFTVIEATQYISKTGGLKQRYILSIRNGVNCVLYSRAPYTVGSKIWLEDFVAFKRIYIDGQEYLLINKER